MNNAYKAYRELVNKYYPQITKSDLIWIIEECASCSYDQLLTYDELDYDSDKLNYLTNETLKGVPLAYTLGYCRFFNLRLKLNRNTLIPRGETEELVALTIKKIKEKFSKITYVDVGTGSGNIALALEQNIPVKSAYAIDISNDALGVAKENGRMYDSKINFLLADTLEPLLKDGIKVDLIISNPPYIKKGNYVEQSVIEYEPYTALFAEDDGLAIYKKIIKESKLVLNDHFLMAFEISPEQEEALKKEIKNTFDNVKIEFIKDINGFVRFMFVER